MKSFGGADSDRWNAHLMGKLVDAIPGASGNQRTGITQAVAAGQLAVKPTDAVEAMITSQMIAANTTSLDCYRRGWVPEQTFEARTRYLALADKAARTVALLAEALDRHRGRGQQQIVVRHVTVNADQAVVADRVLTGRASAGGGDEI